MTKRIDKTDVFVGKKIKEKRISLKITQEELAKKLDITFQQIQKYENGSNRVSAGRLYKISKIFNTSINYFFKGIENE